VDTHKLVTKENHTNKKIQQHYTSTWKLTKAD